MRKYRILVIILASIAVLILLLDVGLNYWIARQLPQIINEQNHSPYNISYKKLEISLFDRNLSATDIVLVPKISLNDNRQKIGYYAKIRSMEVKGFSIWNIIFSNKITAHSLVVNYPEATLFEKKEEKKEKKPASKNFDYFSKIIYVSDIYINHGTFLVTDIEKDMKIMRINNLSLQVEGILVTDETLSKKIPFTYNDFLLTSDSIYYRKDEFYHIKTGKIKVTKNAVSVASTRMIPEYGRKAFVKIIPKEKDLYTVSVKQISVGNLDWGFKADKFFLHSRSIIADGLNADIYRGKMPPDDLSKKKLYNQLLREIKFEMKIDTLAIRNSKIVYEEEKDFSNGAGKLSFNKFNLWAVNIASGYDRKKMPDVKIHVNCQFMDIAPFKADWSFNVLDKSDTFHIKGSVLHFPAERLAPFTKPYSNTIVEGDLDEIYFDFIGNDHKSKGTFGINYDDLKVKIYKKNDRKKKNKLLSAIANLFVKNNTKEKVKRTEVEVDRVQEKSVYNMLWLSVADGLKKILL